MWRKSQKIAAFREHHQFQWGISAMFDYHFRIFGAERLKVLTPRTGHGSFCSFCSFSPISPGERTGRFGTQVPRSIGWYLSSSEEVPVVRCHRTLWDGDGSGIAFILGIHGMCTPTGGNLDGRWWTRMIIVSPLNCNCCNLWAIPGQLYLCQPLTHLWCNGRIPKTGRLSYYKGQIALGSVRSFVKQLMLHATTTKRHIVIGYLCIYFIYFPSI